MYRINSPRDVVATGTVEIDAGEGVTLTVPTVPAESGGGVSPDHPALYESGWRDITSSIPASVASGRAYILRAGSTVWIDFDDLVTTDPPAAQWHDWSGFIAAGFRVRRSFTFVPIAFTGTRIGEPAPEEPQINPDLIYNSSQALGPLRLDTAGRTIIYGARSGDGLSALIVRGTASWHTSDPIPTTLPGTPA